MYPSTTNFYPRSPCGERPQHLSICVIELIFLSTLSLRRATVHYDNYNLHCVISIHALLAESDHQAWSGNQQPADFYPRSPCGERLIWVDKTQSAPNFYPRSPCGERHNKKSDHLLPTNFYPRSPCGERPTSNQPERQARHISIHALLAESDSAPRITPTASRNFYPRSPCGERQPATSRNDKHDIFLSTLSLRRATPYNLMIHYRQKISIHALLAESDRETGSLFFLGRRFLSTLSLRRATHH